MNVGIDCVDIGRFRKLRGATRSHFLTRTFSAQERAYCEKTADSATRYASTFAAKEAVVKALAGRVGTIEVDIRRTQAGQPEVFVRGRRRAIAVSMTHEAGLACAIAMSK